MADANDHQFDPGSESLSFPTDSVAGVFESADDAAAALHALSAEGVPEESLHVLCGPDGARRLDPSGERHGAMGRLHRVIQQYADKEVQHAERYADELRAGHYLVAAVARDEEEAGLVAGIFEGHGAHFVNRYGRWTVKRVAD